MKEIFTFLQTVSPLMLLGLSLVIIFQLVNGKDLLKKIFGTQKEKYPELKEFMAKTNQVFAQNEKLLTNHFNHEIPDMVRSINRIEEKLDTVQVDVSSLGQRISHIEGKLEK